MNFKSIILLSTFFFILFMFLIPLAFQNKIKENLEGSKLRLLIPEKLLKQETSYVKKPTKLLFVTPKPTATTTTTITPTTTTTSTTTTTTPEPTTTTTTPKPTTTTTTTPKPTTTTTTPKPTTTTTTTTTTTQPPYINYQFYIKLWNVAYGGNSDSVLLKANGTKGTTGWIEMLSDPDRGASATKNITHRNIGELQSLELHNTGNDIALKKAYVKNTKNNDTLEAGCNNQGIKGAKGCDGKWLDSDYNGTIVRKY